VGGPVRRVLQDKDVAAEVAVWSVRLHLAVTRQRLECMHVWSGLWCWTLTAPLIQMHKHPLAIDPYERPNIDEHEDHDRHHQHSEMVNRNVYRSGGHVFA
jgi:hypothetical protein